mmetsp:Transcript_27553/g.84502  ORF Transcript_27553/g.84502 Transcript_27553/m.84502 type:complete len:137 (-) Transcript_27553:2613-3023(-)
MARLEEDPSLVEYLCRDRYIALGVPETARRKLVDGDGKTTRLRAALLTPREDWLTLFCREFESDDFAWLAVARMARVARRLDSVDRSWRRASNHRSGTSNRRKRRSVRKRFNKKDPLSAIPEDTVVEHGALLVVVG